MTSSGFSRKKRFVALLALFISAALIVYFLVKDSPAPPLSDPSEKVHLADRNSGEHKVTPSTGVEDSEVHKKTVKNPRLGGDNQAPEPAEEVQVQPFLDAIAKILDRRASMVREALANKIHSSDAPEAVMSMLRGVSDQAPEDFEELAKLLEDAPQVYEFIFEASFLLTEHIRNCTEPRVVSVFHRWLASLPTDRKRETWGVAQSFALPSIAAEVSTATSASSEVRNELTVPDLKYLMGHASVLGLDGPSAGQVYTLDIAKAYSSGVIFVLRQEQRKRMVEPLVKLRANIVVDGKVLAMLPEIDAAILRCGGMIPTFEEQFVDLLTKRTQPPHFEKIALFKYLGANESFSDVHALTLQFKRLTSLIPKDELQVSAANYSSNLARSYFQRIGMGSPSNKSLPDAQAHKVIDEYLNADASVRFALSGLITQVMMKVESATLADRIFDDILAQERYSPDPEATDDTKHIWANWILHAALHADHEVALARAETLLNDGVSATPQARGVWSGMASALITFARRDAGPTIEKQFKALITRILSHDNMVYASIDVWQTLYDLAQAKAWHDLDPYVKHNLERAKALKQAKHVVDAIEQAHKNLLKLLEPED
ncbi:MAG: hypothetical protein KDB07_06455 [Planctomycetes bacterium]|nr:hypothetical protein [Planctomycetota bacterium]